MSLGALWLGLPSRVVQLWLLFHRQEAKRIHLTPARLQRRNESSAASITAPGGPVVSMTTYGQRLASVHLALESIAAGTVLPSRLILWVDDPSALVQPSAGLKRLVDRGLELRLSENFGPHTKYYPYLLSTETFDTPLVTADDDLLYSDWWLEGLVSAFHKYPECVNCYRAHVIKLNNGAFAPYRSWSSCSTTLPNMLHFATGVSGVIYPPHLLRSLKHAGSEFLQICPKSDDVWLHVHALRGCVLIRQIWDRPMRFPFVPDTQATGLYHSNVLQSHNDAYIARTYTAADLVLLHNADTRRL